MQHTHAIFYLLLQKKYQNLRFVTFYDGRVRHFAITSKN